MTRRARPDPTLRQLDKPTRGLIRLAAVIASGSEQELRSGLAEAEDVVSRSWVEELILQSYLFCGFPRSLNAMREWRRLTGQHALPSVEAADLNEWRRRGEATCEQVYGEMYERLRVNILALHPELDDWMIVEGYGKVLSRPGLDLPRRELCIVAACAASRQERQLHSHLHGAVNVGVSPHAVSEAIDALDGVVNEQDVTSARLLWRRVQSQLRVESH